MTARFPNRLAVERAIADAKNHGGMRLNDGKERVTLPGGTLQYMLATMDNHVAQLEAMRAQADQFVAGPAVQASPPATPEQVGDPTDESLSQALGAVMSGILSSAREELRNTPQEQLDRYWYFVWNPEMAVPWNIYRFTDMLRLYSGQCRKWEEIHNPTLPCVVERVRDTYLMPKIRRFEEQLVEAFLAQGKALQAAFPEDGTDAPGVPADQDHSNEPNLEFLLRGMLDGLMDELIQGACSAQALSDARLWGGSFITNALRTPLNPGAPITAPLEEMLQGMLTQIDLCGVSLPMISYLDTWGRVLIGQVAKEAAKRALNASAASAAPCGTDGVDGDGLTD